MIVSLIAGALAMPHNKPEPTGGHHGDLSGHHGDFNGQPGWIGGPQNQHGTGKTHLRSQPAQVERIPMFAEIVPDVSVFQRN